MSAPNQGRQSPEPERQSGAQAGATSTNANDHGVAGSAEETKNSSEDTLKNLGSNPKGPMDDKAHDARAKGQGNASGAQ